MPRGGAGRGEAAHAASGNAGAGAAAHAQTTALEQATMLESATAGAGGEQGNGRCEPAYAELATEVLKERFGDKVSEVVRVMLDRGPLAVHELVHAVNVERAKEHWDKDGAGAVGDDGKEGAQTAEQVRNVLRLLVHHNIVYSVENPPPPPKPGQSTEVHAKLQPTYSFMCSARIVCQRISYPAYQLLVRDELGALAELVVSILMDEGRLSYGSIAKKAHQEIQELHRKSVGVVKNEAGAAEPPPPPSSRHEDIKYVFRILVDQRFVERVPSAGVPPYDTPKVKQRQSERASGSNGPKSGSRAFAKVQEQQVQMMEDGNGSTLYGKWTATRFELPPGLGPGDDAAAAAMADVSPHGGGRKRGRATEDADGPPTKAMRGDDSSGKTRASEPLVRWRVNHDEFVRRLRHFEVAQFARQMDGQHAGAALATMLCANRQNEVHPPREEEQTYALAAVDAMEATKAHRRKMSQVVKRSALVLQGGGSGGGSALAPSAASSRSAKERETYPNPPNDLEAQLNRLSKNPAEFLRVAGEGPSGTTFSVVMSRAVNWIKLKQVEGMIRQRFGDLALRCFRAVQQLKILNTLQVSERAMISPRETNMQLYRLLRAGFLLLQEVQRPSERVQPRLSHAWRYDFPSMSKHYTGLLHITAARLMQRKHHIDSSNTSAIDDGTGSITQGLRAMTAQEKLALKHAIATTKNLEEQLMQVDQLIRLFADF